MTRWHYPNRRSPRLKGYDYTREGVYFVTICVQNRLPLFGAVLNDEMTLNEAGQMVGYWWGELVKRFPQIDLDAFVVMPNHLHGIVVIIDQTGTSLSHIMGWFKTMTTNAYIHGVNEANWEAYTGRLWQRSFHDHIIRHQVALNKIRAYILNNPALWLDDTFHP